MVKKATQNSVSLEMRVNTFDLMNLNAYFNYLSMKFC